MDEIEFYLKDLESRFKGIDKTKYYLSYSGGKDSHFLYWFIKEYLHDTEIEIVGINTYMEHPQILKRIQKYSDVILYPALKPFEIKEQYGIPCFSKNQDEHIYYYQKGSRRPYLMERIYGVDSSGNSWHRYSLNSKARDLLLADKLHPISPKCCTFLKKKPAHKYEKETGRKPILGIRSSESALRKKAYKKCFTKDGRFTPLHDLSDELLNKIYEKYNIEIPPIYNLIERTGCMGCPYGSHKGDTEKELYLVTKQQRKFLGDYFGESYKVLGIDIEKIKAECGDYE